MTIRIRLHLRMRTVVLAVGAAILTWLVISRSFTAYLSEVAPQKALWLDPQEPNALVNLADSALNGLQNRDRPPAANVDRSPAAPQKNAAAGTNPVANNAAAKLHNVNRDFSEFNIVDPKRGVDLSTIRAWAESSLMGAPLNARALRILGQTAAAAGNNVDAAKFMQLAAHLSLHESVAVYWLLIQSAEAKDYKSAVYYADIILRTLPGFDSYVVPILARVAEDKESANLLKTVLMGDPPWRSNFLQNLPRFVDDERIPLDLLLALRTSSRPPTRADINSYLDFLLQQKMYELAYYTWLQFLPARELRSVGLLYNGDFEAAPSGSPFDWLITQGSGVAVDVEEMPDKHGDHALVLDFEYGRVEYHSVKQLVMLAPGRYQFDGRYKGELVGPRGLKWRVACAESPRKPFAEGEMIRGHGSAWSNTKLDFTVPQQDCRAQYLSLDLDARMPSEEFITGSIWFDELGIKRMTNAAGE